MLKTVIFRYSFRVIKKLIMKNKDSLKFIPET